MTTGSKQNENLAAGHLMAAADEADKLITLLQAMTSIVNNRVNAPALVGGAMAQTIEDLAEKVVADIRLAVRATE